MNPYPTIRRSGSGAQRLSIVESGDMRFLCSDMRALVAPRGAALQRAILWPEAEGGDRSEQKTTDPIARRRSAACRAALRRPAISVEADPHAHAAPGGQRGRRDDPHRRAEDEREHGPADPDREP